jgi:hypothetical protein
LSGRICPARGIHGYTVINYNIMKGIIVSLLSQTI